MSLFDQIKKDMYAAMKAGDKKKTATLRAVFSRLKDKKIEKRDDLTETEEIKVLQSLVKQHKESIDTYAKGGRDDLVQSEKAELEIVESYLPQMMDENEIRALVKEVISEVGAESLADIGKVMPVIMQRGQGKIDGKTANQMVRELLQ